VVVFSGYRLSTDHSYQVEEFWAAGLKNGPVKIKIIGKNRPNNLYLVHHPIICIHKFLLHFFRWFGGEGGNLIFFSSGLIFLVGPAPGVLAGTGNSATDDKHIFSLILIDTNVMCLNAIGLICHLIGEHISFFLAYRWLQNIKEMKSKVFFVLFKFKCYFFISFIFSSEPNLKISV
jgi:hypothetical protein